MSEQSARLILIRHAHIETSMEGGTMCGWLDLPLSPAGERQLRSFRSEPSKFKPAALYASSLLRARTTAEALASSWRLELNIEPQLREINCGVFEGMRITEIKNRYPELWAQNASQDNDDFAWPEGETYRNFRTRVFNALSRIAGLHRNARVAVVTHAGVISQVVGVLNGLSPAVWEQYRPAPFTATEIVWTGHLPRQLLSFNIPDWWRCGFPS